MDDKEVKDIQGELQALYHIDFWTDADRKRIGELEGRLKILRPQEPDHPDFSDLAKAAGIVKEQNVARGWVHDNLYYEKKKAERIAVLKVIRQREDEFYAREREKRNMGDMIDEAELKGEER